MRRRCGFVLVLAFAFGCTPRHEEAPEPSPPPPKPEPTIEPASTPSDPIMPPPIPIPGFVVHTEDRTILVPADGSPRVIAEGIWVADERSAPAPVTHTLVMNRDRVARTKLPACACLGLPGACPLEALESRRFDPQTGSIVEAPDPSCTCVALPVSLAYSPGEVDGQYFEACTTYESEGVAALVAGRLEFQGWEGNGACFASDNVYDATTRNHALIADPPELTEAGMRSLGCDDSHLDTPAVVRPWPVDERALVECGNGDEYGLFVLRRGYLWHVGYSISGAGGHREYAKRPVRPESCPSINDPCGDPGPFRARAGLDRLGREFWIATDGSAALTAERDAYVLWRADSEAPIEFELPGVDASHDVIGVRVNADLRPMIELIERYRGLGIDRVERAPRVVDPQSCLELDALDCSPDVSSREWGEACVMWIEIEEWNRAETNCLCGLAVADTPASRAALLFNLGSIAQAEGAREQAAAHYAESLELRPDNPTVRYRLNHLRRSDSR